MKKFFLVLTVFLWTSCLTVAGLYHNDKSVEDGDPTLGGLSGNTFVLEINCNADDALILINGSVYGKTDKTGWWSVRLRSGIYQITVIKENFENYTDNVKLDQNRSINFKFTDKK